MNDDEIHGTIEKLVAEEHEDWSWCYVDETIFRLSRG
jgi:hypothetical protein